MLIKMSIWARPLIYQFSKEISSLILLMEDLIENSFRMDMENKEKMHFLPER